MSHFTKEDNTMKFVETIPGHERCGWQMPDGQVLPPKVDDPFDPDAIIWWD